MQPEGEPPGVKKYLTVSNGQAKYLMLRRCWLLDVVACIYAQLWVKDMEAGDSGLWVKLLENNSCRLFASF